jgi:DNA-binding response OmpR family regulator
MRAQDGGPPVIFVTGYSADAEIEQKLRASAYSILHKPFSPRELGRRVRELLDQTQAHLTRQQSG